MTRVTITLETPLAEALRAEALREDRPVSSVARRAFARYFTAAAREAARQKTPVKAAPGPGRGRLNPGAGVSGRAEAAAGMSPKTRAPGARCGNAKGGGR